MKQMRNVVHKVLVGKLKGKDYLGDLGVDRSITGPLDRKEIWYDCVWTVLNGLRIGSISGLVDCIKRAEDRIHYQTFGLY
jgi:hypothetical protein